MYRAKKLQKEGKSGAKKGMFDNRDVPTPIQEIRKIFNRLFQLELSSRNFFFSPICRLLPDDEGNKKRKIDRLPINHTKICVLLLPAISRQRNKRKKERTKQKWKYVKSFILDESFVTRCRKSSFFITITRSNCKK